MRVSSQLLKDILSENPAKRQRIRDKMEHFEKILVKDKKGVSGLSSGFYARKVEGTDIYKFRVSSGDRVLFKYETQDNNQTGVYFIRYCKHDEQIRAAYSFRNGGGTVDQDRELDIVGGAYEEDEIDAKINDYVQHEVYAELARIRGNDIFSDEYISLAAEEDREESVKYLSIEQYDCLKSSTSKPIIILGCAGSGKTVIALRRLVINNGMGIKTAYVSKTEFIVNKAQERYELVYGSDDNISFYTFNDLFASVAQLDLSNIKIIGYKHFYDWFHNSNYMRHLNDKVNCHTAWLEINTLIKGAITENDDLNQDQYNVQSRLTDAEKKTIYRIYELYMNWTESHYLYDTNDLAKLVLRNNNSNEKFNYIVCDEAQELTEKQVAALISLLERTSDILLLADANQTTQISRFYLQVFKNHVYSANSKPDEFFLVKNYRNGSETINWINAFKKIKLDKFESSFDRSLQYELFVKEGMKPRMLLDYTNLSPSFINEVGRDSNTAIVVADEHNKPECERRGFDPHRMFTVEEIRGLEYDNIFCFDILTSYDEAWNKVLLNDNTDERYAVYFNIVYIAATRARRNLFFLEKKETCIDKYLSTYLDFIKNENELSSFIEVNVSEEEWLKEAVKLEKSGNFYQASEAYLKAGRTDDAKACQKAYERDQIKSYGTSSATYIQIIIDTKLNDGTFRHVPICLEKAISALYTKYDCVMCGTVYVFVPVQHNFGEIKIETAKLFIDADMTKTKEVADAIDLASTYRYHHYIIAARFFELNTSDPNVPRPNFLRPKELENMTIYVDKNVSLKTGMSKDYEKQLKMLFKEVDDFINENTPMNLLNAASQVRNQNKYKTRTSDDILGYIFGES